MELKRVALHDTHVELGAKMVPFAGFEMPVHYEGIAAEHINVRENVGIFDVSHMGEFRVQGSDALDFLQRVTTNDVAKLFPGKVQYTCMPNRKGGIVDDLLIYCFSEQEYLLVVNASNIQKDWDWLQQNLEGEVIMTDESDDTSLLAVQGPHAARALQLLTGVNLEEMKYYTFVRERLAGVNNVIISATGYTGAGGFELYLPREHTAEVWNQIMALGKDYALKPAGLGARDTLRLEMGLCLYGNDIDDTTSPIEAGLGWITKFNKDFINAEALKKQKEEGPERKLVGFVMQERGIPRKDYLIFNPEGEEIGRVTSGTQSPSTKKLIGMGYVKTGYAQPGTEIRVEIRGKMIPAEVHKPPFIKK